MSLGLYNGTLYRFQAEIVANAYLRPRNIAIVDTGLGKLVRDSEPILTPTGWVSADKIEVGDRIIGVDGRGHPVTGVYPQGRSQIVRMTFSDGSTADTSWDHLWTVQDARNDRPSRHPREQHPGLPAGRWRTMTTRQIADAGVKYSNGGRKWKIPLVSPVEFEERRELPIDPYTLGIWLAEGTAGMLSLNALDAPAITERIGIQWKAVSGTGSAVAPLVGHVARLRNLGLLECRSWEKFIPADYLFASVDDRLAILQGLMDGDGSTSTHHHNEFSTTSPQLRDGVVHLVQSLGGVCRIGKERRTTYTHNGERRLGRVSYRVGVKLPPQMMPFSIPRKLASFDAVVKYHPSRMIEAIEEVDSEDARCFMVDSPSNLYVMSQFVVTHNTHLALALIALSIEDDLIDRAIVVVEGNKVDEWMADIAEFTQLSAVKYRGESKARKKRLLKRRDSQVVVSTYQTLREDLVEGKKFDPGFLMQTFEGERLLIIYDEVTVLGGRTSRTHQVHRFFAHTFDARLLGLTATPVTSGAESYYNLGRIFCPDLVGTVEQFHREHVVRFDSFHNPAQYRNLELLAEKMAPVILRKRKTDPDVVDQFPKTVEDFVKVQLNEDHRKLYDDLEALCDELSEEQLSPAFQLLCAFANHPRSIFSSQSTIAQMFLERHTHDEITKVVCAKTESVLRKMKAVTDQGDQAVVFCNSVQVLDELYADAVAKGLSVARYHGGLSNDTREANKTAFKAGQVKILLCSSAGERGINLPEASYIINYDVPTMHSSYIQRLSRASRIGSNAGEILVVVTYVAAGTAEEGSVRAWNKRNAQSDTLIDFDVDPADEYFTSASDRKHMIKEASKR